jgi:2-dehydro-3-deoxy-D-gluconate 5-dehydrogenase
VDLGLAGRVAIVTGASRGLGRAIAAGLAAEGVSVLAAARSEDDLASLAAQYPGQVVAARCDVADEGQVRALLPAALDAFGGLDIVVNNAGIAPAGAFAEMPLAEWRRVFDVNVLAPVALCQAAGHHLRAQGSGKIVNIGSLSSLRGKPVLAAYSASKGALLRLTEALSAEWARDGVQVNMIAPGGFATEAQQHVLDDPAILARRVRKIPAGRMGAADEIAALACYLASPLSDFVTGSCYTIDGGELAKL